MRNATTSAVQIGNASNDSQASLYFSSLVRRPYYSSQHLQKVVSQPKVVSELLDTLIRLRAENVKRLLKESGSGASSSFNRNAHGSTYMPRTFLQILPTAYLLAKVPLQL